MKTNLSYFYSLLLYFFYALPIFLSGVLFKDDVHRVLSNSGTSWVRDGRPFLAGVNYILNFGTSVYNISPLTQILGLLIICTSIYLFVKKYLSDYSTGLQVLCITSFIISPFFLENLGYSFESLGMCIALALTVLPFCFFDNLPLPYTGLLYMIVAFCVMCFYQPVVMAMLIFVMITLFLNPAIRKLSLARVGGICAGGILYMLSVAQFMVAHDGYQGKHAGLTTDVTIWLKNFQVYMNQYRLMFFPDVDSPIAFLFVLVVIAVLFSLVGYIKTLDKKDWYVGLFPFISIPITVLPLCLLTNPIYMPRATISFNVVFFFGMILLAMLIKKAKFMVWLPIMVVLWSFVFSYTLGNVVRAQEHYQDRLTSYIAYDLGKINMGKNTKIFIDGKRAVSQEALNAEKKYKIFHVMNNSLVRTDVEFFGPYLSHHLNKNIEVSIGKVITKDKKLQILSAHALYLILTDGQNVIIFIR